jgi:hypothetical protein
LGRLGIYRRGILVVLGAGGLVRHLPSCVLKRAPARISVAGHYERLTLK